MLLLNTDFEQHISVASDFVTLDTI